MFEVGVPEFGKMIFQVLVINYIDEYTHIYIYIYIYHYISIYIYTYKYTYFSYARTCWYIIWYMIMCYENYVSLSLSLSLYLYIYIYPYAFIDHSCCSKKLRGTSCQVAGARWGASKRVEVVEVAYMSICVILVENRNGYAFQMFPRFFPLENFLSLSLYSSHLSCQSNPFLALTRQPWQRLSRWYFRSGAILRGSPTSFGTVPKTNHSQGMNGTWLRNHDLIRNHFIMPSKMAMLVTTSGRASPARKARNIKTASIDVVVGHRPKLGWFSI